MLMKKAAIQSHRINKGKLIRSCRHVKDLVVHVIVWWIMESHTNTACISDLVWPYTVLLNKEAGSLKSKTRQHLADREIGNFFKLTELTLKHPTKHPWPPDHRPPPTQPLYCSLTLLLQQFSAFFFLGGGFKLKLKSSKVCFILSTLHPCEMAAFPETIATISWAMSSWLIIKCHTDNA